MKLLVVAQKIDKEDDILGFFPLWVEELAKKTESVFVISNYVGKHDLPKNVKIFSLGKERGYSRLRRYLIFYKHLFGLLPKSDGFFAHMCPEYVLAAWPLNFILRKKIVLWYVHRSVTWKLRLAEKLVQKIFTVSKKSINVRSSKVEVVGHGIDTGSFKKLAGSKKEPNTVLYIGRIARIKKIECIIEAAKMLDKKYVDFRLSVVGSPFLKDDFKYDKKLKELGGDLVEKGKLRFFPKVKNSSTPEIYNCHEVCVNLSPVGLFDKTILEAMACETLIVVSNREFEGVLSDRFIFEENNAESLAEKLQYVFGLKPEEKGNFGELFRNYVAKNHNLEKLAGKIIKCFNV